MIKTWVDQFLIDLALTLGPEVECGHKVTYFNFYLYAWYCQRVRKYVTLIHMIYFSVNQPLPSDKVKRALQLFWINDILVKFLIAQGAKLSAVKPVFLMDFHDFEVYVKEIGDKKLMNISRDTYEIISGPLRK